MYNCKDEKRRRGRRPTAIPQFAPDASFFRVRSDHRNLILLCREGHGKHVQNIRIPSLDYRQGLRVSDISTNENAKILHSLK